MTPARTVGPVRIVGTGLLGTSVGLALSAKGVDVILDDVVRSAVRLAVDYGAGRPAAADDLPALIIVAVPPDDAGTVAARELARFPEALVTDVASVKTAVLDALIDENADVSRYVGSHPMAGRERGGAVAARADLFLGRPWVITPHAQSSALQERAIESLALDLGATPIRMAASDHDMAVALVSHLPQLMASLTAARLNAADVPDEYLNLAGQGLRDTTRVAASDPALWVQILAANHVPVGDLLKAVRSDLDGLIDALDAPSARGASRAVVDAIAAGNEGVARIPGKHGQKRAFEVVTVQVADRPGELARLLAEIGEEGVNLEDLRIEHSPGAQLGFAEVSVLPERAAGLSAALEGRGWTLGGGE